MTPAPKPSPAAPATGATAGLVLATYLNEQATAVLRGLRLYEEGGADGASGTADATHQVARAAERIRAALHAFRPLTDPAWSDHTRAELAWLAALLAGEHAYAARLDRLLGALHRLAGAGALPAQPGTPPARGLGAARAAALLQRRLGLARSKAHTAALQAVGSARYHAVADAVAVLASETPLSPAADAPAEALLPLAETSRRHLVEATAALPLARASRPYNAEALARGLSATAPGLQEGAGAAGAAGAAEQAVSEWQDAPWRRVRGLLRQARYVQEVLQTRPPGAEAEPNGARPTSQSGLRPPAADGPHSPAGVGPHASAGDGPHSPTGNGPHSPTGVGPHPSAGNGPHSPAVNGPHQPAGNGPYSPAPSLPPASLHRSAARLLDRHRDAAEAAAAAAAAAQTPRIAPATAYALGVLHADQRHEVEAARFAFGRLWTPGGPGEEEPERR
ncbi:CHAD domain-containing protein [Streptomyces boninensis]|uniref:CHAD domain-containing protein n=1 Tax=Streptomyces boninensis TaxID=2039455 RepID=UPI003B21416E